MTSPRLWRAAGRSFDTSRKAPRVKRRLIVLGAASLLAALWSSPPLVAAGFQPVIPLVSLVPNGLRVNGRFGSALSVGEGVVAVGAYLSPAGGQDSGAVYLFRSDPTAAGGWSFVTMLRGPTPGDWFGFDVSVAADGKTLLVGAPRARDGSGAQTGAAYRFDLGDLSSGQVLAQGPLPIEGGKAGDEIGSAVAVSGASWAVGARGDSQAGNGAGGVYVCCRQGRPAEKLVLPDAPADGAEFGQSVSLDGCPPADGAEFGKPVSLDGCLLAVGAPFAQVAGAPAGAAYVFEGSANGWKPPFPLPANVRQGDAFGYAVAVSALAKEVVVGAPLDDGHGTDAGAAYLYRRQSTGWQLQAPRLDASSDAAAGTGAQFGVAVTIDRMAPYAIAAGARRAHGDQGAAYLFDANGQAPPQVLSSPHLQAGAEFGFEIAMRGGTLVVGAFLQDGGAGAAYLFAPVPKTVQVVTVQLAAPSVTVPESAGTVRLPLVVTTGGDNKPTTAPVTVQVKTQDGSATKGSDFQLVHDSVTIPAGTAPPGQAAVEIAIAQSPLFEADETFTVELLPNPAGAVLGAQVMEVMTIHDDDPAGLTIALAHPAPLRTDDDGAADSFTISLLSQPSADVMVSFAGALGQGVLSPATLVFTAADWNQPRTVTISGVDPPTCLGQTATSYAITATTASADPRYAAFSPPTTPTYPVPVVNRHRDRTHIVPTLLVAAPVAGTVSYMLTLLNDGECGLEIQPEEHVDSLSWDDLSLVVATATLGTATVDLVANRVSWSGTIQPGMTAKITIVAAIQGPLNCRQVRNQGSLTYSSQTGGPPITVFTNPAVFFACP